MLTGNGRHFDTWRLIHKKKQRPIKKNEKKAEQLNIKKNEQLSATATGAQVFLFNSLCRHAFLYKMTTSLQPQDHFIFYCLVAALCNKGIKLWC